MAVITEGNRRMDASALREYFQPLENWLRKDNKKHGAAVGWKLGHDGKAELYHPLKKIAANSPTLGAL
ncbi:unnamed protein product [Darwinula stevensoni]|uniref:Uncharacterized protein n=1 Tax=Darwinula stevensoni TaxID=69355 RepID=A0A7R9FTK4_9CRUS|nr:unnamed protein product [Darwinula stevensoni]CAG0905579.1 unnamed protein product [Darwinula stevensoni]